MIFVCLCLFVCAELIEELTRATDLKLQVLRSKAISPLISEKGDKMYWPIRFEGPPRCLN